MGKLRGDATWRSTYGLSVVTLVLWGLATVLSITLPVVETGSDPTELPMAAFFAPTAATVLTGLAGVVISVFRRGPDRHVIADSPAYRSAPSCSGPKIACSRRRRTRSRLRLTLEV